MIKHNGFHLGDFATWDPRSDTMFLYLQEIKEASEYLSIPTFEQLAYSHESFHRTFYRTRAVSDILIVNGTVTKILTTPGELSPTQFLPDWKIRQLKSTIKNNFDHMEDVGNILDIEHVLDLFLSYESENMPNIKDLKRYSRVILGHMSLQVLDDFSWFSKNVREWWKIIVALIYCSLDLGFAGNPESRFDYVGKSESLPFSRSQMLFDLIDTSRGIFEANSVEASEIFKEIPPLYGNNQFVVKAKSLIKKLSKYCDSLHVTENIGTDEQFYDEVQRRFEIFRLQGKKFQKMNPVELEQQSPLLTVEQQLDESYMVFKRKNLRFKNYIFALHNLAMTHLQECIVKGLELECYLCSIGFCEKHLKFNWKWMNRLHREIGNLNRVIYH